MNQKGHTRNHYAHRTDLAGEHRWGDLGQVILLALFICGTILDLYVFHLSRGWQDMAPWYLRLIIFIPLLFFAGFFAQRAHKKIFGESREKLQVIDTDVYARLRHPMYFGSLLVYLGCVILSLSLVSSILFIVAVLFYSYLCWYEEQILVEKLGDEYRAYQQQVPMLFPKLFR